MAIQVDTSKPLTDEQIAELRTRLPENLVQRYVELAEAGAGAEPAQSDEPSGEGEAAPTGRRAKSTKQGDDLLS